MATSTSTATTGSTISFVDEMIKKLSPSNTSILSFTIGNVNVSSSVALSLVAWLLSNRTNLEFIGKESFHSFLDLFDRGQKEAAFQALLAKMDANAIIAQMNADAATLKMDNDARDAFFKSLEQLLINTAESLGPKILMAAIL